MSYSPTPDWELMKADFDINYTEMNKEENPHILSQLIQSHIANNYSNHLKIFTDGSVLENEQACPGFVIPEIKKTDKASTQEKLYLHLLQNQLHF